VGGWMGGWMGVCVCVIIIYIYLLHTCQLKLRKVPGAGYATSNVEGLRAKALLAQAKATAKKGVGDLEAASAAHLQLESKSAQLHKAIERYQYTYIFLILCHTYIFLILPYIFLILCQTSFLYCAIHLSNCRGAYSQHYSLC